MRSMIKKATALFLAGAMAFGLAACGGKDNKPDGTAASDFVYVPKYISMPGETSDENFYRNTSVIQLVGNKLYYSESIYDQAKGTSENKFYSLDVGEEGASPAELPISLESNRSPMRQIVDKDGSIYMALQTYAETGNPEQPYDYQKPSYSLIKYQADGTVAYETDITSYLSEREYSNIQGMAIDKDGNLYVTNSETNIWVFGSDGNLLCDIALSQWVSGMGTSKDGDVYIQQWGDSSQVLTLVDIQAKALGKSYSGLPNDLSSDVFQKGLNQDFLLRSNNALCEYSLADQTYEEVLNFIDCDIAPNNIQYVSALEDGRIFIYTSDWENDAKEIMLLTKTPASEVTQKEIITLGTMGVDYSLQAVVVSFNKSNPQYRIKIKDYSANIGSGENGYNDAITHMNNEFLTGNAPDLISLAYNVNVSQLAAKGVLEDQMPYLEKSTLLKKEDMVSSVLKAYTESGVLVGIPTSFYVNTLMSASSLVGDEMGWTLDEMMAVMDSMPEDAQILEYASKSSILRMCMSYNADAFINWETGECKFDSEEFIKVLEFANRFPEDADFGEDRPSMPELVRTGKLLLVDQSLSDTGNYQVMKTIWGEPITCIGYPSSTTNGSAIAGQGVIGLNAKSQNKDAAWEFIEFYLDFAGKSDRYRWGFPVFESELDKYFEEAMVPSYVTDENGNPVLDENGEPVQSSKGGYGWGNSNEMFEIYAATQEEVDAIREVINSTTTRISDDMRMVDIMQEEAAPYFQGQKGAKEVADIIQSRIQIYINESR